MNLLVISTTYRKFSPIPANPPARNELRMLPLLFACAAALFLSACSESPKGTWQGYAEGELVGVTPMEGGIVEEIAVASGDRVNKGDLLFRLDRRTQEAALERAEAGIAKAKATLRETELAYRRKLALRSQRNVAQAELDTAQARLDRAGAATLAAASALTEAKWRLARREGHAPSNAVVQEIMFREGESAGPDQPVVSLLPPQNIKVRFFVPEAELAQIAEGSKVGLACAGCTEGLTGTIRFIDGEPKEGLAYMAEATPDERPEELRPGQPVTVSLAAPNIE